MARVIRGAEVQRAVVLDAVDEASNIVEGARRQAAAEAEAGRDAIREELREAAESHAQTELAATLIQLETRYREERESLRTQVTTLALAVASKVIGSEVSARPELVGRWVEEAVSRVSRANVVTVRVHPQDVERLDLGAGRSVSVDDTLTPGDCIVESELGVIDGRLSLKLDALREALETGST